jgi:hypothetical protein
MVEYENERNKLVRFYTKITLSNFWLLRLRVYHDGLEPLAYSNTELGSFTQ